MNASTAQGPNRSLLFRLVVIACLMFGFAWALIPLYRIVCEATGINALGVAETAPAQAAAGQPVTLRFDANVQPGLPWQVRPLRNQVSARPGQFVQVEYEITNASNRRVVGQAVPRYLPGEAAQYVKKLECFCFRQQAFQPGETRRFPVVLVLDKQIPAGIREVTLAYSVFDVPGSGG